MKKIKVYTVVCSYNTEKEDVNIELYKMLERLQIKSNDTYWGTDYNIKEVVQWNVDKGYRVLYQPIVGFIKDIPEKLPIGMAYDHDSAQQLAKYLNDIHDRMLMELTDYEAEIKLRKYGNNYTNQIKGGKRL